MSYSLVYGFSKSYLDWSETDEKTSKTILGGKGAALVKMIQAGINVPPGFTFTTETCHKMNSASAAAVKLGIKSAIESQMKRLATNFGFEPLVSVRSGAPVSMPGMMDTILNVGLNDANIQVWVDRIGPRAAWDSYRRLIQMLGSTAYGVPSELFSNALEEIKAESGAAQDADLSALALTTLVDRYKAIFHKHTDLEFPQSSRTQLFAATMAVFNSWHNERAIEYRKLNNIDAAMGTACTVQAMVFGNMGKDSGTGVLFTRDPSTGENYIMGEFLQDAQGEDVVAGIRTPVSLHKMSALGGVWVSIHDQIVNLCHDLEASYKDMVDVEFTVQNGVLYVLQSRTGKRSARAAFKIAHDLVVAGVIDWETASKRLTREQYKIVRRPSIDPKFKTEANLVGIPACPGVVTGKPVFSVTDAVASAAAGEPCILVSHETTPEDIKGMHASVGILTVHGGSTSHAAVVARAMDKACVVGCTSLSITDLKAKNPKSITIDGSTGNVWVDVTVPVVDSSDAPELRAFAKWALGSEAEAVTLDGGCHNQSIKAAHWWGSMEVLETVIDGIAKLPDRTMITLDLRSPRELAADSDLLDCFGVMPDDFKQAALSAILSRKDDLYGVQLLTGAPVFGFPLGCVGIPLDYAAFNALHS